MRRVIARYFKKCLYRAKNKYCSVTLCAEKNIPLKKRAVHRPRALSVGYFACAQYDVLFIPYRHFVPLRLRGGRAPFVAIATFPPFQRGNLPRRRKRVLFYCLCEQSEAISREGVGLRRHILLTLVVGYFAIAQYDVRSPIGTSCLAMTTSRAMVRWDISLTLNMTYYCFLLRGRFPR